ncbi:hypothetical protein TURU_092643 [Turdus rufiventris]|nr:hypothetical protein TURU_092643 [Turdus rufiventris]
MDALGKVVLELHRQWGIDCKVKDFECAVTRLLKLGAIDCTVDILHSERWDKCTKVLANDVMFSGSSKCLKSWRKVTQALQKALLEQETWKAAQSCLKATPKVGVGATTQTAFSDSPADSDLPPEVKDCSQSRSRSSNSTPDLTAKQGQQLEGDNTYGLESGLNSADAEEAWERPPPYAPQNGARKEGEGQGEELLPATGMRKREPKGKGEESVDDKKEESPRPNQGTRPRTLPFKESNSPKGSWRRGGKERGQSPIKRHRRPETSHHSTSSSESDEDYVYSRHPNYYHPRPPWDTKRWDAKRYSFSSDSNSDRERIPAAFTKLTSLPALCVVKKSLQKTYATYKLERN